MNAEKINFFIFILFLLFFALNSSFYITKIEKTQTELLLLIFLTH